MGDLSGGEGLEEISKVLGNINSLIDLGLSGCGGLKEILKVLDN